MWSALARELEAALRVHHLGEGAWRDRRSTARARPAGATRRWPASAAPLAAVVVSRPSLRAGEPVGRGHVDERDLAELAAGGGDGAVGRDRDVVSGSTSAGTVIGGSSVAPRGDGELARAVDVQVAVARERDRAVRGANLDEAGPVERDRERVVARGERAGLRRSCRARRRGRRRSCRAPRRRRRATGGSRRCSRSRCRSRPRRGAIPGR